MMGEEIAIEMSEDISEYFSALSSRRQSSEERKKPWVEEVTYKVKKQIKAGKLGISPTQR